MTVPFSYPYNISPDTAAVASEVQDNFDDLLSWIQANYFQIDATPPLTAIPILPGDPTVPSHAANKAYVDAVMPTGAILEFGADVAPAGYLLCDGASYSTTGQYQELFNVIGYNYGGSGGSFNVPDKGGKVTVGKAATGGAFDWGVSGGVADAVLPAHVHDGPSHSHTITHGHDDNLAAPAHTHSVDPPNTATTSDSHTHTYSNSAGSTLQGLAAGTAYGGFISNTGSDAHTHTVNIAAFTSGGASATALTGQVTAHTGSSAQAGTGDTSSTGEANITNKNFPPYVISNYIIKT